MAATSHAMDAAAGLILSKTQRGTTEFEGDYWIASTEATQGYGINVRREPCTSSFILGMVEPGDTVLATRERSGSWMKLVDWDGKGACWIFRGDEDDLLEFISACDAPSVYEDSETSSDDEENETGANTGEDNAASGDDPGDD